MRSGCACLWTASTTAPKPTTCSGPGFRPGEQYHGLYAFDAIYGTAYTAALRTIIDGRAPSQLLERAWERPDRLRAGAPPGTVLYTGVDNHDQNPRAAALRGG